MSIFTKDIELKFSNSEQVDNFIKLLEENTTLTQSKIEYRELKDKDEILEFFNRKMK